MKIKMPLSGIRIIILLLVLFWFFPNQVQARRLKYTAQTDLKMSGRRSRYSSDEVFANYRYVKGGDISPHMLYRGVSPYDRTMKRAPYADRLLKRDKIKTVINLDRTSIPGRINKKKSPYYYKLWKKGNVKKLNATIRLQDKTFQKKVAAGLRFMSRRKGPYYIHCKIGRDRTGYFCALLECFMGASYREVTEDYMKTYENFYGKMSKKKVRRIKSQTIIPILKEISGSDHPSKVNLKVRSSRFMTRLGITKAELKRIRRNLKKKK